jgi:hypothetical protein
MNPWKFRLRTVEMGRSPGHCLWSHTRDLLVYDHSSSSCFAGKILFCASVATLYPFSGTRAILLSFRFGMCAYGDMLMYIKVLIGFVFLPWWLCNELLLPFRIPPSELSDTRKPSHNEKEINWIGWIEARWSAKLMWCVAAADWICYRPGKTRKHGVR